MYINWKKYLNFDLDKYEYQKKFKEFMEIFNVKLPKTKPFNCAESDAAY